MNRKELVRRIATVMRDGDIRKPISIPKQIFHISDDEGNSKDFIIRKTDKNVLFTIEDIEVVLDACLAVIEDSLRHGEAVSIRGFGTLGLKYRKPRIMKHVGTGEEVVAEGRYTPKFYAGNNLRTDAKIYEAYMDDNYINEPLPFYRDDEPDEERD